MWWVIIGVILAFIILDILKDTHIEVYYYGKLARQYDFGLPVWIALIMVLILITPAMNVIASIAFFIYYIIKTLPCDGCLSKDLVFSLNGNTWLTKNLLLVKKVLNKKV